MSKAVLISIHPKWCELIASGKKSVELRKTRPKVDTPFKCYIYETRGYERVGNENLNCIIGGNGRGKVIGEFVCDKINRIDVPYPAYWHELDKSVIDSVLGGTCLSLAQIHDYLGHRSGYGWHISDLKVYDEPKPLEQFQIPTSFPARRVRQGPQSWCYIDEVEKRLIGTEVTL